jgi:hypothetical protein
MLPETVNNDLAHKFKSRYSPYSAELKGRVALTFNAFNSVQVRVPAYLAIKDFLRSQTVQLMQAHQSQQPLPSNHPLTNPLSFSVEGTLESCIVSFAKPFTRGNGNSVVTTAKELEPFLRNDMIPILSQYSGIAIADIVEKAITQRHTMVAHIDADAFDFREHPGCSIMKSPTAGYERSDVEALGNVANLFCWGLSPIISLWTTQSSTTSGYP